MCAASFVHAPPGALKAYLEGSNATPRKAPRSRPLADVGRWDGWKATSSRASPVPRGNNNVSEFQGLEGCAVSATQHFGVHATLPSESASATPLVPRRPLTPLKIESDMSKLSSAQGAPPYGQGEVAKSNPGAAACRWTGVKHLRNLKSRIPHEMLDIYGPVQVEEKKPTRQRHQPSRTNFVQDLYEFVNAFAPRKVREKTLVLDTGLSNLRKRDKQTTKLHCSPGKKVVHVAKCDDKKPSSRLQTKDSKTQTARTLRSASPSLHRSVGSEEASARENEQIESQHVSGAPQIVEAIKERWSTTNGYGRCPANNEALPGKENSDRMLKWMIAVKLKLPLDLVDAAAEIFVRYARVDETHVPEPTKSNFFHSDEHDEAETIRTDANVLSDGLLDSSEFTTILCDLSDCNKPSHLPGPLLMYCYQFENDEGSVIGFEEFAQWFSRICFSEQLLLSPGQVTVRSLARHNGMSCLDVDDIKAAFDTFDKDGSGEIDEDEFGSLLYKLLKIPPHLELPKSRVKQFWVETDTDGGGVVEFEEFLKFYRRYFDSKAPKSEKVDPLQDFYRGIRPVGV